MVPTSSDNRGCTECKYAHVVFLHRVDHGSTLVTDDPSDPSNLWAMTHRVNPLTFLNIYFLLFKHSVTQYDIQYICTYDACQSINFGRLLIPKK